MAMFNIDDLKGHRGSALGIIFVAAGGAKTALAMKRNDFEFVAFVATIYSISVTPVTAADHSFDIINDSLTGV